MTAGDPRRDAIWHDRDAESPVVLEVSRACPRPMLPTGGRPGRASAAPAAGPAVGAGAVGARGHRRRQRLPERRGGGAGTAGLRPVCHPATAARMDLRRGRAGRAVRHDAGGGGMFRGTPGVGHPVVEWADAAAGHRCHIAGPALGGPQHQRALPRLRSPRGLACHPGPRPGPGDRPAAGTAAAAGPGCPAGDDGAGADRSRAVESPIVAQHQGLWLASADARAARCHLCAVGPAPPAGARCCRDQGTPGSAPAPPSNMARSAARARWSPSGTPTRPNRGWC